jgi:hypothetical protein
MQHKDIKTGDQLLYVSWGGQTAPVTVLDTDAKLYSKRAVVVRFDQSTGGYTAGNRATLEARQLVKPGSEQARLRDGVSARARTEEIAAQLEKMGFKRNSPQGFRIRNTMSTPSFTLPWSVLDQLMPDMASGSGSLERLLDDVTDD